MKLTYGIQLHPAAEKQLERLYRSDRKLAARFDRHIQELAHNPYPADVKILEHTDAYDLCRTRVGQAWRLQYAVLGRQLLVLIVEAGPRQNAYQNLETLLRRIETYLSDIE